MVFAGTNDELLFLLKSVINQQTNETINLFSKSLIFQGGPK